MSAAASATCPRTALQPVARLGFDDGWLLLGPTFLNLQRPVLLVDRMYLSSTIGLGFESFGCRDPRSSLPDCGVDVLVCGGGVSLWDKSSRCLASHWFDDVALPAVRIDSEEIVLLVGDTYEVEASWSALWLCLVGAARARQLARTSCAARQQACDNAR